LAHEGKTEREPVCVYCRHRTVSRQWRPFCSERCKLLDLRNWVDERYRIEGETASSLPNQDDSSDRLDGDGLGD